jgi:hypothetical protein
LNPIFYLIDLNSLPNQIANFFGLSLQDAGLVLLLLLVGTGLVGASYHEVGILVESIFLIGILAFGVLMSWVSVWLLVAVFFIIAAAFGLGLVKKVFGK